MCYGFDGAAALRQSVAERGVDRRSFLRGAVGAAAVGAIGALGSAQPARAASGAANRVPAGLISIQLYTLRSILSSDFDGTLRALADIGYPRVELAGYYGRTASELRTFMDSIGVEPSSSHDGISGNAAGLETKIENAITLGQRFIVVPFLNSTSASDWQQWADQMNAEAAVARSAGLRYGYHNHAHEFSQVLDNGQVAWEILTSRLDPSLVHLEADLYWVVTGGLQSGMATEATAEQFAIDTIRSAPQRVLQYHVKDRDPGVDPFTNAFADAGTGFIDFGRIFAANPVLEYIVENDQPDVTPLQTAQVGFRYLRTLRF
ncbi:MAG: sugar phosphate isomerase/epimerase family protein [Actinomycetes bacterium]